MLGFSGQLQEKIEVLKQEIEAINKRYNETVNISDYALWEYDIFARTMYLTKKLHGKFEDTNKVIPNYREKMIEWKIVHPEDLQIFTKYCDSMDNGDSKFSYEYRQITDNNLFNWLRTEGTTVFDNAGNPKRVIGRTIDITVEKEKDDILIERAHTDYLTKVNTKENAYNLINAALNNANGVKCAFLLIDVDDFKYINDSFGHSFGDSVLLQAATLFTANKNNHMDVVGRLGGDEFCVFLYNIESEEDVLKYYNNVKHQLNNIVLGDNDHLRISVGAVVYPDQANNLDEILANADLALYQTKFNNKDSITFFDASMQMPDLSSSIRHSRSIQSLSAIENIEVSNSNEVDPVKVKDDLINSYEAFRNLNVAYYIINDDYTIKYCSPNLKEVFPTCEKVIIGSPCYQVIRANSAPCADCPLRNNMNANIHFASNYSSSHMDYNVTYHKFNNNSNILVCWNDLTDFSKASAFVTDYLTQTMIYSSFIIDINKLINSHNIDWRIVYIAIDDFRNLSKNNDLDIAIDISSELSDIIKKRINSNELVTSTSPYEFYVLMSKDDQIDKRVESLRLDAERLLRKSFELDININIGYSDINPDDNNAHLIAINAKRNCGGNI